MIRHKIRIVLLSIGVLAGYGSAAAHWAHCRHARHRAFEQHVARTCVDAAHASARGEPHRW